MPTITEKPGNLSPRLTTISQKANAVPKTHGALVISLDFELHWGVRDIKPLDAAERERLLSARRVIPRILDLFKEFDIHATWATVGFLFASSREELMEFAPTRKPAYRNQMFDPYNERIGSNEADDPFHFAPGLIDTVANYPGQEIASHSFSHYYCMEEGQTADSFEADIVSAVGLAQAKGYRIQSYVFPRNQAAPAYLTALNRAGLSCYRGTEPCAVKKPTHFRAQRRFHNRIGRLFDSYVDLFGNQIHKWPPRDALVSIPASRYLSPYRPSLRSFEARRQLRIVEAMKEAAIQRAIFHLWWHPEDFAFHPDANLTFLRRILLQFDRLRREHGMASLSMAEAARL